MGTQRCNHEAPNINDDCKHQDMQHRETMSPPSCRARVWRRSFPGPCDTGAGQVCEVAEIFADDLSFSMPAGIDYISQNESVHAGSLLAWHSASRTLHVDDTINLIPVPRLLKRFFPKPRVFLHPTTSKALLPETGAVRDLRNWVQELAAQCHDLRHLCAAHSGLRSFQPGEFSQELLAAFHRIEDKLNRTEVNRH